MMDSLKPCPALKDSGVPWLGEVPEHWEVAALRHRYSQVLGKMLDAKRITGTHSLPYLRNTDVQWDRINVSSLPIMDIAPAEYGRYTLQKGDLLVCEGGEVGRCAIWAGTLDVCGFQKALHRLRPLKLERDVSRFMYYSLRAAANGNAFSDGHVSTIAHLTGEKLRAHPFPFPPFLEQAAIVRILDHVDRRIRRYIRAKQKLIKLLEEQKQAIIHRAVTRGLDPNVRLKPSGLEWLGDMPEHWEVKRLHQITDPKRPIMYGIVLPGPSVDEGVFIVKGGDCEPGRLRPERLSRTTFEIESRYVRSRLVANDIVFAIRGGVGASEIVPPDLAGANLTQDAARIASGEGISPRWLLYAVRAPIFRQHVKSQVVGATVRGINIRSLKRIDLVVPPCEEQETIADYIAQATNHIVTAIDGAQREISLLREYRTRLIADVVTGKLDVRDAAARLPNEGEEPEPLDDADPFTDVEQAALEDLDAIPEEEAEA